MKWVKLGLGGLTAVGLAACETDEGEEAEEFPTGNIEIIVPYEEGGGTDLVARAFADLLEEELGESVSVTNQEGGGGAVGMQTGAESEADGHTLTLATVELLTLPHTDLADLDYEEDFETVAMLNEDPAAITVPEDSDYETIEDFIEAAQDGEDIQIGNSGTGAIWHLAASALEEEIDASFDHVPYDGASPAVNDLLGGHIDAVAVSPAEVSTQVEGGDLRVLGVMGEEPEDHLPDVPTFEEIGIDLSIGTWRGIAAPADTPDEVIDTLNEAAETVAESEEFQDQLDELDLSYRYEDTDGFQDHLDEQDEFFEELIPEIDIEEEE